MVYALPKMQRVIQVPFVPGMTVGQALTSSGILKELAQIDLTAAKTGIFGRQCRLDRKLKAGDRVEIYRPLATDPKEARRLKVRC